MIEYETHYDVNRWMGVRTAGMGDILPSGEAISNILGGAIGGFSIQTVLLFGIFGLALWRMVSTSRPAKMYRRHKARKARAKKVGELLTKVRSIPRGPLKA